MFLRYSFDIKPFAKIGKNILEVKMKSTLNKMDAFDTKDYEAVFNRPRVFLRKAQCHFGWDWAPKNCAYGIWDYVFLSTHSRYQINEISIKSRLNGTISLFFELNYNVRPTHKSNGSLAIPAMKIRVI